MKTTVRVIVGVRGTNGVRDRWDYRRGEISRRKMEEM